MYSFSSRNCGIGRSVIFWRDSDASDPANMFLPSSNSARITPFEKISDRCSVILSTISYSNLFFISNRVAINAISNRQTTVSGTANGKEQNIV